MSDTPNQLPRGPGKFFLSVYGTADIQLHTRARYTLYLVAVLVAADFVPLVLMFAKGLMLVELVYRLVVLLLLAVVLGLLRAGRQAVAANTLLLATIMVLWGFMYMREYNHYYELYTLAFLLELAVIMSCLISRKTWMPFGVAGINLLAILVFYAIRARVLAPPEQQGKVLESLFFIVIFMAISGFLGLSIMKGLQTFLDLAHREMDLNRNRARELAGLVQMVRQGMGTGDRIMEFVDVNSRQVHDSRISLEELKAEFGRYAVTLGSANQRSSQIVARSTVVKDQTRDHAAAMHQTTAAIEEINATIDTAWSQSAGRREQAQSLAGLTEQGAGDMKRSAEAIRNIAESSRVITDIGGLIRKIASQTNLLAMNASIEAAHAGQFGRGFAVVAQEIRTLAEQSDHNAQEITQTLKKITAEIAQAGELSHKAGETFRNIREGVAGVQQSMETILTALGEIRAGVGEITAASLHTRQASQQVDTEVSGMAELATASAAELAALREAMERQEQAILAALERFAAMARGMQELEGLGRENLVQMAGLDRSMEKLDAAAD